MQPAVSALCWIAMAAALVCGRAAATRDLEVTMEQLSVRGTSVSFVSCGSECEHGLMCVHFFRRPCPSMQAWDAAALLQQLDADGSKPVIEAECSSMVRNTQATAHGSGLELPSLLELERRDAASAPHASHSGLPADLDCSCQPSACDCDKQCFCSIRTDSYQGHRLVPPSGLDALSGTPPDHDCACSLNEVGGPGFDSQNTIDCDCTVAACSCSRKCTCTLRGGAGL